MNRPQPTRSQAIQHPYLQQRLHDDLDQAVARTLDLVQEHAGQAIGEQRPLRREENAAMLAANAALARPAVTSTDLLQMVQPHAEWFETDTLEEGLQNHAAYHAGRPGEYGTACPGLLTLPPPERTP